MLLLLLLLQAQLCLIWHRRLQRPWCRAWCLSLTPTRPWFPRPGPASRHLCFHRHRLLTSAKRLQLLRCMRDTVVYWQSQLWQNKISLAYFLGASPRQRTASPPLPTTFKILKKNDHHSSIKQVFNLSTWQIYITWWSWFTVALLLNSRSFILETFSITSTVTFVLTVRELFVTCDALVACANCQRKTATSKHSLEPASNREIDGKEQVRVTYCFTYWM